MVSYRSMIEERGLTLKKYMIIPDSFKGTLSSMEVSKIIQEEIIKVDPQADIKTLPVADGGEGSVTAFLAILPGKKVFVRVKNPYFEMMTSFYGLIDSGKTAIIEMAACAGLPLVEDRLNPALTTTYGVGELILHALDHGVNKIILGLGGSATNDGGCGCAAALGVKFYNKDHLSFIPTGGTLHLIESIDLSGIDCRLTHVKFITMCDIDHPLYGHEGAAYVFGPQKGADPAMVAMLDTHLKHLSHKVKQATGFNDPFFKGAGAAGGMGYGVKVFFNATIQMGIETILDAIHFDELAKDVDVIITGEGKLDYQSLRGKVVIGVARRAKKTKAKVVAVVGAMEGEKEDFQKEGVDHIIITNYLNLSFEKLKLRAEDDIRHTLSLFLKHHRL